MIKSNVAVVSKARVVVASDEQLRRRWVMAGYSGLVGLALLASLLGCAQQPAVQTSKGPATLPATLKGDPRFSDLVQVIDFAGQSRTFADARDVTMLAPTNAAFRSSDPSWSAALTGADDISIAKRRTFLRPLLIQGNHPLSDFAGKMQDVRTVLGDVLHIDGRTPGKVIITAGQRPASGIGFPNQTVATSRMELPPLVTSAGPIYPVDTIIIK